MVGILKAYKTLLQIHRRRLEPEAKLLLKILVKDGPKNLFILSEYNDHCRTHMSEYTLKAWGDIMIDTGIDLSQAVHLQNLADRDLCPPAWRGCGWHLCVCNDMQPCHSMRVCKGCWKIRYCSSVCQKKWVPLITFTTDPVLNFNDLSWRDWAADHKNVCVSSNEEASWLCSIVLLLFIYTTYLFSPLRRC